MIVGLPTAGLGTMFYVLLLLGMGATNLWRWGRRSLRCLITGPEREPVPDPTHLHPLRGDRPGEPAGASSRV